MTYQIQEHLGTYALMRGQQLVMQTTSLDEAERVQKVLEERNPTTQEN